MKSEFFSGIAEVLSRVISLVLVLAFYIIFFMGKGNIILGTLLGQGALILGSITLYELLAFVFYELFSFVESTVKPDSKASDTQTNLVEFSSLNLSAQETEHVNIADTNQEK